jgi:light-regulated signal transduction histidine kinase (bacteriophytochrome)
MASRYVSNMKPLLSETQDVRTLQEIGLASIQIVHDLKNQLNGLKLYATFLRKRMEKSERPLDEMETIGKLINGLERAATDMTALVRYGRPLELRLQPRVDLVRILTEIATREGVHFETEIKNLEGEFDAAAITEALKIITVGALNMPRTRDGASELSIHLRREEAQGETAALVEWRGLKLNVEHDPFHSFAGSDALRMSLAAKIIVAHGGEAGQRRDTLSVRLPLKERDE